jgi:cytochrome c-type biogenesis protein CcmH
MYVMAKKGTATLAVRRVDKPSFPFAFEIAGGDAMMGGAAFEGPVDVVARVSRTGDAIPAKGDLEGVAKGVKVPARDVKLTIDSVRP